MGMHAEDQRLLEAFRRGEESAFSALVIKYRETVYRLARRMLGNHEDAADATQEVFLRAYRALARFDGRSKLSTWLYRVTVNLCLDMRERGARQPVVVEVETAAEAALGPGLADEAAGRETGRLVRRAIAGLPPRQRAMVALRLYHDLPYQEIARIMRCSEGTVKATMFAALRTLRRALAAQGVRG
ncbi:MAG: RNA polymerase sigma factor [Armatimonadota bacterium]|nr:RNA polymerase sigma factor [Armatimonadota bacterium]